MGTEVKMRKLPPCDFDAGHGPAVVDGRTRRGPWGYMCAACWADHGCGRFGTGHAQRLVLDVSAPSAGELPEGDPCGLCVHRRDAHRQTADPWELLGVACLVDGCPCARYVPPAWGPSAPAERPEVPSGPAVPAGAQTAASAGPVPGTWLRRCTGCGWETVADRCPHCGANVEGHRSLMDCTVITEVLRAADHLGSAVAKMTAAERETPEGVELVDMAQDADRLWRQLDEGAEL